MDITHSYITSRNNNDDIIIFPVKDDLVTKKHLNENMTLNLVVVRSKAGRPRWGTIVCFLPADTSFKQAISATTLQKIFAGDNADIDGKFIFLSLTGKLLYSIEYKNHRVLKHATLRTKANPQVNGTILKTNFNCTAWFLVTTTYYSDGSYDETWQYLGTSCRGCDNEEYMSFCPDGGNGGGGGGGSSSPDDPQDNSYKIEITDYSNEDNYSNDDYNYSDGTVTASGSNPPSPDYVLIAYTHNAEELRNGDRANSSGYNV